MRCLNCGKEIPVSAGFCRYCGTKTGTRSGKRFCAACGTELGETARFCNVCGAPFGSAVSQTAAVPATQVPSKKKKRKWWMSAIALVLVAAIVFSCVKFYTGRKKIETEESSEASVGTSSETDSYDLTMSSTPSFTGISDVVFDARSAISVETVTVGSESTDYTLSSGVSVSFDPYSLCDSEHDLTVSSLGEKNDGEYQCIAYDLLLDGEEANLAGVACISLPYDPSWGENVFVQYYNEDSGNWEILYTETDGNGNAVFYTDHFCTFGVFCKMVLGALDKPVGESGKVFQIYGDDPLNKQVYVDYAALAATLREPSSSTIKETAGQNSAYFVEKGLDTIGFYSSVAETYARGAEVSLLAQGLDEVSGFAGSTAEMLGHFGAVVTVSKLMTNVYSRGENVDFYEVLKDNRNDLISLALYAGGTLGAGSVASFCNAAGILFFVYSTTDSAITSIDLGGNKDIPEYAYRNFTTKYIVYDKQTGVCSTRYVTDVWEDASTYYQENQIALPCKAASDYAEWKDFFDSVKKLKPNEIPTKLENVLTQYTSIFWNLPKTDPDTLKKYLDNTTTKLGTDKLAEKYSRPSDDKIKEYKAALKSDLYRWLRPYMQECLRKSYFAMLNDAFREATELQEQFNARMSFVLKDAEAENFSESDYAQYKNTLSGTNSGDIGYESAESISADSWRFTEENGYSVSCTYLSYLLSGTPAYLRVQNGDSDILTMEIDPTYPETVILLGEAPKEETPALSGDYVWVLTDVWYGDRSPDNGTQDTDYPLRLYAIYNNGEGTLTPFEYGYEVTFDERELGFIISLNSIAGSSSKAMVLSPGKIVRSLEDFVFRASSSDFTIDTSWGEAYEASAPYFEVTVQNTKDGSVYYLTDGSDARISGGSLTPETITDSIYGDGLKLSGEIMISESSAETVGEKVLFDTYGVCFLYTVLPADQAETTNTEIHHGDFWAISVAADSLDSWGQ